MKDHESEWRTWEEPIWEKARRESLRQLLRERLTRRELIRYGGLAGMSLSVLWALACAKGVVEAPKPGETPRAAEPAKPPKTLKRPQELTVVMYSFPNFLDPQRYGIRGMEYNQVRHIFSSLVKYDDHSAKIVPDLAETWSRSPDGLVYTFKMRKNAQWHHDYGPVTAQDIKWCIEYQKDPANKSAWVKNFEVVDKVETPDDYTVKITLFKPLAPFLWIMVDKGGQMINRKAIEKFGQDAGLRPETTVGSGAYILQEWKLKERLVYAANEKWHLGAPTIKKVTVLQISEISTALMAFEAGKIDVVLNYGVEDHLKYNTDPRFKVVSYPQFSSIHVPFHTKKAPFDNLKVRQAMAYAINKKEVSEAFKGLYPPAHTLPPDYVFGYGDKSAVPEYPYDPAKAKQLLAEAGLAKGFQFEFATIARPEDFWVILPTVLERQWAAIGVKCNIKAMPAATYLDGQTKAEWVVWTDRFTRPPHADQYYYDRFYGKLFAPGRAPYEGTDDLFEQARVEPDEKKQIELYKKLQRKIHYDDAYVINTVYILALAGMHKHVMGFGFNPMYGENWESIWLAD